MLFIMNLDWSRFAISDVVVEGNAYLEKLAASLSVQGKISFNCASLGAGEFLLPYAEGDLGKNEMPKDDTLDYIRWHQQKVRKAMAGNMRFKSNRDLTEMLSNLKKDGHEVATVATTSTEHIEHWLKESRVRDYFDNNVYGYDRRSQEYGGNLTLSGIFATVIKARDANYEETLVVSDDAEGIADAVPLETRAVVGYLDPYVPWNEQTVRLKEMDEAGADYSVVGGHYVRALPFFLNGMSDQIAESTLNGFRHPK